MRKSKNFTKDKWLSKITGKNSYKCKNTNFKEKDYHKDIDFFPPKF